MKYVLIGNYGVGNLGDEALKEYFLSAFPEIAWQVVSAHPHGTAEIPRLPAGVRSLFTPWWKTVSAIGKSDGVVFGGGTLFTDAESVRACLLWWWHAAVARLLGKRVFLAFQGIGPFRTRMGAWLARWVVQRASSISVRDDFSFGWVNRWKLSTEVVRTFDPVFSLFQEENPSVRSKKIFIIIPRKNSSERFWNVIEDTLSSQTFSFVRILSLQPDSPAEQEFCSCLQESLKVPVEYRAIRSLEDLRQAMQDGALVLSQRYHGALAALALGIPCRVVPQGAGDKLAFLEELMEQEQDPQQRRKHLAAQVVLGKETLRKSLLVSKE